MIYNRREPLQLIVCELYLPFTSQQRLLQAVGEVDTTGPDARHFLHCEASSSLHDNDVHDILCDKVYL